MAGRGVGLGGDGGVEVDPSTSCQAQVPAKLPSNSFNSAGGDAFSSALSRQPVNRRSQGENQDTPAWETGNIVNFYRRIREVSECANAAPAADARDLPTMESFIDDLLDHDVRKWLLLEKAQRE